MSAHFPFKQWLTAGQPAEVESLMKEAAERDDVISFAGGLPADDLFPTEAMTDTLARVMAEHGREVLQYHWADGYGPLREQIVEVMRGRGVTVRTGELLITHGAQQALDLLARLFLRTGDPLGIERPTYAAAIQVFKLQRPKLCPIARSEAGLDLDAAQAVAQDTRPNLMYLAPAGHNPIGDALAPATCERLIALAAAHDAFIIEDDAYGSIQFDGPRPPLRAYPGAEERVVYVGTFSKVLTPGLRVGWIVAPRTVIDQLLLLKAAADLQTSSLSQIVLSTYLREHDLGEHLGRCLQSYRERRDATLAALQEHMQGVMRWTRPSSGFSVWATLADGRSSVDLLATALAHDVAFEPGAAFFPTDPEPQHLRLSFSNLRPAQISEGVRRLADALRAG